MTSPTGNVHLDSISWGGWQWIPGGGNPGDPVTLNVFFDDDYSTWTAGEKASYLAAFDAWASVTNITVNVVADEASANFIAHTLSDAQMTTLAGPGVFGFHETPDTAVGGQVHGYFNYQGYSWPESGWVYDEGGLAVGGWGHYTMMHELGHGLGFAHPHDTGGGSNIMPGVSSSSDTGTNDQNQGVFSVMSYNAGWVNGQQALDDGIADYGYNSGLGAFDIALAQYYYGANTTQNTGNDTYIIPEMGGWLSIWDAGGNDTVRYNGSADAVINLNSATLDGSATGGGFLSYLMDGASDNYYGGYTIAADFTDALADVDGETGVIIENAFGGSGNDLITGNAVNNRLIGRNGGDSIKGLDGNDTLNGGNGLDTLNGGNGDDILIGAGDKDILIGGNGTDRLKGGDGNDVLNGGAGDKDKMWGEAGIDAFVFRNGYGKDIVMDMTDDEDIIRLDDNLWEGTMTVQEVLDEYARDNGNHVILNFGDGDILVIRNIDNVNDLVDDIVII